VTALAQPRRKAAVQRPATTGDCSTWRSVVPVQRIRPHPDLSHPQRPSGSALPVGGADCPHLRGVPLLCPMCGGQMRIIAFITHSAEIRHILDHIGAESEPPHISPARGPPLWDDCDARWMRCARRARLGLAAQPAPDFEVDQRVNW
jgi:hypothetical protein